MAKQLRIGIVGAGNIGRTHARSYQALDDVAVVAVCDLDRPRAEAMAADIGATAFGSVAEMLAADLGLDACSVTTAGVENGSHHYAPTMELLAADLPVLGEKPISNNIDEAREMVALARERKVRYGINLNHRFTPAAERARQWLEEGRLGKPHMIMMRMWINNPNESSPWFHMRALHPHSLDVVRYFAGDVQRVCAFFMKGEGRQIWSNAQVLLELGNGMIGTLVGSYDAGGSYGLESCELVGSKGRFLLEEACQRLTYFRRDSVETERYDFLGGMTHFQETFASRIAHWVGQLRAGAAPQEISGSGEDALRAQLIIEACITSFEERRIVELG